MTGHAPRMRNTSESAIFAGTLVAIVSGGTRRTTVETLSELSLPAVRTVLISLGERPDAAPRDEAGTTVIDDLQPRYLNNAIAYARLSSLPTAAWWRSGDPAMLPEVATLVDRLIIHVDDPSSCWAYVPELARVTSVSELRWARLTRWREQFAQLFDMPDVAAVPRWEQLVIAGSDPYDARLLAGWFRSRLPDGGRIRTTLLPGRKPFDSIMLEGQDATLELRLLPNGRCLRTTVQLGERQETRIVPLGDRRPASLLVEELRIRSRDRAYEDAVREAERL